METSSIAPDYPCYPFNPCSKNINSLILQFLIMPNTDFSEIDNLHSEWSRMEKAARLGWLSGERARLTGLANQFSLYIYAKGGIMNDSERAYARKLLDMINSVDAEGSKVMDDLRNDAFKEIVKSIMKHWDICHQPLTQPCGFAGGMEKNIQRV